MVCSLTFKVERSITNQNKTTCLLDKQNNDNKDVTMSTVADEPHLTGEDHIKRSKVSSSLVHHLYFSKEMLSCDIHKDFIQIPYDSFKII